MREKKKPLKVSTDGTSGPYIMVEPGRLDAVCEVLDKNRWPYTIDRNAIQSEGSTAVSVINLGTGADVPAVQSALDGMA